MTRSKKLLNYKRWVVLGLIFTSGLGTVHQATAQDLFRLYQSAQRQNGNWSAQQSEYLANQQNEVLAYSELLPQVGLQGKLQYDYFRPNKQKTTGSLVNLESLNLPAELLEALTSLIPESTAFSAKGGRTTAQIGLALRQPLFRLDSWKNYEKAKIATGIQGIQLLQQHQELTEQVIKAYLNVLQAQAMTDSLTAEYNALKAQDDMMQARLAEGVVARVDTEETRAGLENVRALLATNDVAILTAKQQLSLLTGEPIDEIDPLKQPFNTSLVAPKTIDNWLNQAKNHNLLIQLSQANILLAKKQQELMQVNRYPQVDLVGNIGYQQTTSDNNNIMSGLSDGSSYGIGVTLNVPLYTGGRIDGAAQQAAYQTDAAISRAGFAQQAAITQASQAYLNLMAQKATIEARQVAVEANAKVAQASKVGYDLGVRSMVDSLLAARQYHASRRDLMTAYFNYLSAYVELQKASGNLNASTVQVIDDLLQQ